MANFDEIQDFENDIRSAFGGTGFLSAAQFNDTSDPLGAPKAGLSADLDALAAYVNSLATLPDSPHRAADGTLTSNAEAGRALFLGQGCSSCHVGSSYTDSLRHDVGTIQPSSGSGSWQPLPGVGFDTPTLLGLWSTAPYLHNGQAPTLDDVLLIPGHGSSSTLSSEQRALLVDYLLQIDNDGGPFPAGCDSSQYPGDSDCDGLLDSVETNTGVFVDANNTGTDPLNPDSDADGMSDGAEVAAGYDPLSANSVNVPIPALATLALFFIMVMIRYRLPFVSGVRRP